MNTDDKKSNWVLVSIGYNSALAVPISKISALLNCAIPMEKEYVESKDVWSLSKNYPSMIFMTDEQMTAAKVRSKITES